MHGELLSQWWSAIPSASESFNDYKCHERAKHSINKGHDQLHYVTVDTSWACGVPCSNKVIMLLYKRCQVTSRWNSFQNPLLYWPPLYYVPWGSIQTHSLSICQSPTCCHLIPWRSWEHDSDWHVEFTQIPFSLPILTHTWISPDKKNCILSWRHKITTLESIQCQIIGYIH